jgi:hypothetical protein
MFQPLHFLLLAAGLLLAQIVLLGDFDIRDEEAVRYAVSRSNVVLNLVGQRSETMNFGFDEVHTAWPERLAKWVPRSVPQMPAAMNRVSMLQIAPCFSDAWTASTSWG